MNMRGPGLAAIRSTFSHRNYAIYTAGNTVSLIGMWIQRLAVGWLAWELTKSGFWLGAVAFAHLFPVVLLGPICGVLADRFDRRRVALFSQNLAMIQAVVLTVLMVMDLMTIEILFSLTIVLGIGVAINQPARLSMVPSLVPRENLATAVAISSVIFNVARFIGPAIAGPLIAIFGIATAFAVNAVTYMAMIAALMMLRLEPHEGGRRSAMGMITELREGLRYAFSSRQFAPLLLLIAISALLGRPLFELLPGFADLVFGRGANGLAILTSAIGLGAIVAGLWLALRASMTGLRMIAFTTSVLTGISVAGFALTSDFWLACAMMSVAGFAISACGITTQIMIQMRVDESMRGRVLSLWGLINFGGPAFGAVFLGWLTGYLGMAMPIAAGGVACAAASLWVFYARPPKPAAQTGDAT